MEHAPWVVSFLGDNGSVDDLDDEDLEFEIAVVREDNVFGLDSAGWEDEDKIVLFDHLECDIANIEWMRKIAHTIADALNDKGL